MASEGVFFYVIGCAAQVVMGTEVFSCKGECE